ncbi:MAG TPA: OFA family MFS transporter [Phycisphaerae bacterium]|nr:OFA family MFS transporter [Phycisphaerae bacterium]HNU45850.1 OFA family MFS transporter [Phycisphaerae bacterium]
MDNAKVMNRWLVVVGAILIQLCLGAIYAWSVFTKPLTEAGWSKAQTQAVFSAGLALFAIVMVIAGRMMPKLGPRKLAIAGGVVLGLGYILGGLSGGTSFWPTFLFVGVIGGAGIGLGYVVPIAVGIRWFPDKKGLVSGLAVAGFGFGATLWMTLADSLGRLGGGHFLTTMGLGKTWIIYGIAYLIIVLIGSIWMAFPPEGWKPAGWSPVTPAAKGPAAGTVDFRSGQMLATPQFYMILLTFAFGASAGLMSIGLMKLFPMQALQARGMDTEAASAVATMAMGVFFALSNGIGRIVWGLVSDKIGRKPSIIIMSVTQGVFVILFQFMAGNAATLYLFAVLIGFNFGGNFALFPAITADTFGNKYVGQNYGWVFLAYAVGGIFGPMLGGKLGDMGSFPLAFTICGVLCLVAGGVIAAVRQPKPAAQAVAA